MKKVLILYFSGVGATKKIAELMIDLLPKEYKIDLLSVDSTDTFQNNYCDAFIIGTPVYHTAPAQIVTNFFDRIMPLEKPIPAFIYNTRGLYSCNTNRILAKQLKKKNIITIMDRGYRSPASDVSLFVPSIKKVFEFERHLQTKLTTDCAEFVRLLQSQTVHGYTPRFRISSIFNAPNKLAGQLTTFTVHLYHDRCVRCGKCIENCPHKALKKGNDGYPLFMKKNCENCYRCIHHCPKKALSLSKRRKIQKVIEYK